MAERRRVAGRPRRAGAWLAVVLLALAGTAEGADGVTFLSPWEGSRVAGGPVVVTGRVAGGAVSKVTLNGKPLAVKKEGAGFSATVTPSAGGNVLEATAGGRTYRLGFSYGQGGSGPGFVFHQPVADGECGACHGGRGAAGLKADTCFECHDPWERNTYLHGPVAAGECVFCHDPHGSVFPSMARFSGKEQCSACHDQPSSQGHVSGSKNRDCTGCHDPHGGRDQFFLKK